MKLYSLLYIKSSLQLCLLNISPNVFQTSLCRTRKRERDGEVKTKPPSFIPRPFPHPVRLSYKPLRTGPEKAVELEPTTLSHRF